MFSRWLEKPKRSALILGPRRAGKSTYMKENFPDFKYLTLDDLDVLDLAEKDPKALFREGEKEKVIIDEIQRAPRLTVAVKFAIDQFGSTVLMSGSSRIGLMDATADSLAGRIDILDLPPACWGESDGGPTHLIFEEKAPPTQLKKAQRDLDSFLVYGGFPEVLSALKPDEKSEILANYKNTYFTRDLSLLSNIEDVSGLRAVLQHYARSIGSITQVTNFQNEANISHVTAKKYLNSIYQSGLGFTLLGYHHGPAKRYVKGAKSYYCDAGMVTALGVACSQGQIIENFAVSEMEKRRKLGFYQAEQLYFYKSSSGTEIDLILEEKGILKAVEIKAALNPTKRDVRVLEDFVAADPSRRRGFLFYLGSEYKTINTTRCLPIASLYRGR